MRSLTKIVFIHSAHIRYGEVALDGNVHFTGTQGVGKTTLLRALLFFYNARKDKLGIRNQGQRTFDDYYVPTSSSYIIYEVTRGEDHPPFCVILFRHHNRAAFRFVDAPFDRSWIIDELGVVASDPLTVRQRLQSRDIDFSGIIDRYNHYLDILYGNRTAKISKDLLKYYLLRSAQYQNIPRIIQNVFLNERVDAGFIKDTIISSITGDEVETSIDLDYFRGRLKNFSDELEDISLWTRKNKQGIVETRRDADRIIDLAHEISAGEFTMREQCGMLAYSRIKAERNLPILTSKIEKKQAAIEKLKENIKSLESKFTRDHEAFIKKIAERDSDLKEAAKLKKKYQQMGISNMIVRVDSLPSRRLALQQQQRLLAQLNANYASIDQKYTSLRDRLNLDFQQFRQARNDEFNEAHQKALDKQQAAFEIRENLKNEVDAKFKTQKDEINSKMAKCRDDRHELELKRLEASKSSPLKDKLEECRSSLSKLEKDENSLKEEKLRKEGILESMRIQLEMDCQRLENEYATQIMTLENRINCLTDDLNSERALLDKSQGSFCEWLDQNVAGWESSIGKIVDEKEVLYSQNLDPVVAAGSQSDALFGVRVDLGEIDKEVRTPAMIKENVKALQAEVDSLANEINRVREEKEQSISATGKKKASEIKSVQARIDEIEQKIQLCRQQARKEQLRLEEIENEEKEKLNEIEAGFNEEIRTATLEIDACVEEIKNIYER